MMKGLFKKIAMGVLAIAVVMSGGVSNPQTIMAGSSTTIDRDGKLLFEIREGEHEFTAKNVSTALTVHNSNLKQGNYNARLVCYQDSESDYDLLESDYDLLITSIDGKDFVSWATADEDHNEEYDVDVWLEKLSIEAELNNADLVISIGGRTFENCKKLSEIICQPNVKIKAIGCHAFWDCIALNKIDLTNVETIYDFAFEGCTSIGEVTLNNIKAIKTGVFLGCTGLELVEFKNLDSECTIDAEAFLGVGSAGGENNPVLLLPADWTGDEPGENGYWYGGYFRYVKSMSITEETIILTEGEDKQLTAEASPIESENKAVTWSSSDTSVAKVDENGKVTAVSVGNTTITVTSAIDERKTATCSVTVNHVFIDQVKAGLEGQCVNKETCTSEGKYYKYCIYCDALSSETFTVEPFGHAWDEGVISKESSYTDKGIKTFTCKNDNTHKKIVDIQLGDVVSEDLDEKTEASIASGEVWMTGVKDVTYSGSAVTFDIKAYKGNKLLKEGTDYTIKYANNKSACRDYSEQNASKIPTVTLTGKGAYSDVKVTKTFKIEPIEISGEKTYVSNAVVEVKDSFYTPIPTLTVNGKKLKNKTDYIVVYDSEHGSGFKETGDYSIKLEGIGNYRGTIVSSFKIINKDEYALLSKASVTGYAKKFVYDGTAKEQNKSDVVVKVKVGRTTETLTEGTDYTIVYLNNTEVGTASMIIKAVSGSTKYLGEKVVNYAITGTPLSKAKITYENNKTYTGGTVKPEVALKLSDGKTLTEGTDYTIEYQKNVNVGTASIIITGKGIYTGTVKKSFKIKPVELKDETSFTVDIKSVLPKNEKGAYTVDIEVRNNGKLLVKGVDYTLSYKNNKKAGKADDRNAPAVMIKGKGNYAKSIIKTFTIIE